MKVTYLQAKKYLESLIAVENLKLTRKMTVAVLQNYKILYPICKEYQGQKNDIAQRYALKDDNGNFKFEMNQGKPSYRFENGAMFTSFVIESKELCEIEMDINITKVNSVEFDKCYNIEQYDSLTPRQEIDLEWMINYESEEK